MGTGYNRTDTTNNIATGNIINASDLDAEYDAIDAAFDETTGHDHGGGSGNGAPITKIGPIQDFVVSASTVTPKTTNTLDLGTPLLKFKDLNLAGNALIAGTLGVTGTLTASGAVVGNGNWTLGNADTDTITLGASFVTGSVLRSAKAAANTLALAAYDVDGAAYTNLITLTAGNTPTLALTSTGVGTINNMSIGATTASTGAFTTLSTSGTLTANTLNLTNVLAAIYGGTGQTGYAVGDLLYASTTTALSKLADVATGNSLISGGVGVAPSWGKIGLTTHISGTLPVANGGTNLTSYAVGDIVYASGTGTLASLADVATGNALISGGVGIAPSYGKIGLTTHVSGTLPIANGGTNTTATPTLGGVAYGTGTAYAITAAGTSGQILRSNAGAAPTWENLSALGVSTITFGTTGLTPSTATSGAVSVAGTLVAANGGTGQSSYAVGDLLYASTTTALSKLADVATGNSLISGGVGVAPSWGKVGLTTHISGTLPVANGGTNLTTYAVGDIIYASATGTLSKLADVTTGNALISGGVGVAPSYGKIGLTTHVSGTLPLANGGTNATTADAARVQLNVISSTTGSAKIPAGTTAQRDGTPAAGWFRFNSTLGKFEGYSGTTWGSVGGGATGAGGDTVFQENSVSVSTSYTLTTGKNAMSVGPISVASGVSVTVPTGARWVVL